MSLFEDGSLLLIFNHFYPRGDSMTIFEELKQLQDRLDNCKQDIQFCLDLLPDELGSVDSIVVSLFDIELKDPDIKHNGPYCTVKNRIG